MYIDGVKQTNPKNCNDWKLTKLFSFPPGVHQVSISYGDDGMSSAGVLSSIDDVQITGSPWKGTSQYFYKWMPADFDDSSWPGTVDIGNNGMDPWGSRPGISSNAKWIWTSNNVNLGADALVYCRSTRKLRFKKIQNNVITMSIINDNEIFSANATLNFETDKRKLFIRFLIC